jgi:phage anti-repressor protein
MTNISLKEFLKNYTSISHKFINEYYKFYELCEITKFGIEGKKIIKYLNLKGETKFYERVRNNYNVSTDYIIKKLNDRTTKGIQNTFYYFSFDTFEDICMRSSTEKGKAVRDYFIILRKFINYYKNNFAANINSLAKDGKFMYILVTNKGKNIFKPGRTINIRKRLYTYATGKEKHPDIAFIMFVKEPKIVEKCMKIFIKNYKFKENQELYKIDFEILKKVIFSCAEIQNYISNEIKNMDNKKYDTYIVYDETKDIDYLNDNDEIIDYNKGKKKIIR